VAVAVTGLVGDGSTVGADVGVGEAGGVSRAGEGSLQPRTSRLRAKSTVTGKLRIGFTGKGQDVTAHGRRGMAGRCLRAAA
jgi:hypothetical protein